MEVQLLSATPSSTRWPLLSTRCAARVSVSWGGVAALKEQGASIDALHRDVEVLQASAVNTAELLMKAQQELRKVQQSSNSDMEAAHESHNAQHSDLKAAHSHHLNAVESHKAQPGQLEAAHSSQAGIVESHGFKLSCLRQPTTITPPWIPWRTA